VGKVSHWLSSSTSQSSSGKYCTCKSSEAVSDHVVALFGASHRPQQLARRKSRGRGLVLGVSGFRRRGLTVTAAVMPRKLRESGRPHGEGVAEAPRGPGGMKVDATGLEGCTASLGGSPRSETC